jgi:hypothetical protein
VNLPSKNDRLTGSWIHEKLKVELDCLEVETRSRGLQTKYEEVPSFLWLGVGHET